MRGTVSAKWQKAGNILPDTSLESTTGRYWLNDVVTCIEDNLFYLYTQSAALDNKSNQNHLSVNAPSSWYNHAIGKVLLEPSDIPSCTSVENGSIVSYQGVYYWFASVQTKDDDSGKIVALLQSKNLQEKPIFIGFVLTSNGRDPRVIITNDEHPFLMVISRLDGVEFYRSFDGKMWQLENSYPISHLGIIECPQYLPSLNGQEALMFGGNAYETAGTTGTYLSWGSYSKAGGWVESSRQRLDMGADCYGTYLDAKNSRFYSWVGNWSYMPDLLLGRRFGQITTQGVGFGTGGKLVLMPLKGDDAYPSHVSNQEVNFEGSYSDIGFRQIPSYCQATLYIQSPLEEGEFIALSGGGEATLSLTKTKAGFQFSRNDTSTIPFYDLGDFNKDFDIPLKDGSYTKITLRLTPYSLNLYLETGQDQASAQFFITQPHDALQLITHFNQTYDPNSGEVTHENQYSGWVSLDYIPQDVKASMGLTKRQADGLYLTNKLQVVQTFSNDSETNIKQITTNNESGDLIIRKLYDDDPKAAVAFPSYGSVKELLTSKIDTLDKNDDINARIVKIFVEKATQTLHAIDDSGQEWKFAPADRITSIKVMN